MRERGSVSILVAATLAALLVIAMGSADVVRVLTTAARAQTAADAAALAAAQTMAFPEEGVVPADLARTFAARNGGALQTCECEPDTFEAIVTVRMPVGPLFLSGDDRAVTASARAIVDLPSL